MSSNFKTVLLNIEINESDDFVKFKPDKGNKIKITLETWRNRKKGFLLSDGLYYPLLAPKKPGQAYTILGKQASKKEYKELFENPSSQKYAELTKKFTDMPTALAESLFEWMNNPQWDNDLGITKPAPPASGKTINIMNRRDLFEPQAGAKQLVSEQEEKMNAPPEADASLVTEPKTVKIKLKKKPKFKVQGEGEGNLIPASAPGMIEIAGKFLDEDALKRGEYGFVIDDTLYPMFKMDIIPQIGSNWEFVESQMLPQEIELFKRMAKEQNEVRRMDLYYKYYGSSDYNIPKEVIKKSLEIANKNNQVVKDYISGLRRQGVNVKEGFNISDYEPDDTLLERIMKTIEGVTDVSKADMDKYKEEKRRQREEAKLSEESFRQYSKTPEEIEKYFESLSTSPRQATRKKPDSGDGESKGPDPPAPAPAQPAPAPAPVPVQPPQPPAGGAGGAVPVQPPQPPAPPPIQPSVSGPTVADETRGQVLRDRQAREIQLQEEKKEEEEKKDDLPDISRYGHKLAVQNIFKKNNKDFTFFKKLIASDSKLKPNEDKSIRKRRIDIILAEYDTLFPLPEGLQSDYELEECLEIITFEYCYKENVRFEKNWKRQIQKLNIIVNPQMGGGQNVQGMSQGLIVNMAGLGLNVGQVINNPGAIPQPPGAGVPPGAVPPGAVPAGAPPVPPPAGVQGAIQGAVQGTRVPLPDKKMKKIRGGVVSQEYDGIAEPLTEKPKSTKKQRKTRQLKRPIQMKIRKKNIKTRLFSNLNHQPSQQNLRPSGELPKLKMRIAKINKTRFKL